MLMTGQSITSAADPLSMTDVRNLWQQIQSPSDHFIAEIGRLRAVMRIDAKQYQARKRALPYCVAGIFNPAHRRSEHFAYIEHFIVDVDHLSEKGLDPMEVRSRLQADERLALCFLSPSGDGLKLLFHLTERCYDAGMYALFYRAFTHQFSQQYDLQQVVDTRTCDVTRACFLSFDPIAYFNPIATAVAMSDFLDPTDTASIFMTDQRTKQEVVQNTKKEETPLPVDPDAEVLARIKAQLGQRKAQLQVTQQVPIFVPEVLNEMIADLSNAISEVGLTLDEVVDIQYGKKLKVSLGVRHGEVNVFCGKRGYSVVPTPKRGCSLELNEIVADLLKCYLCIV